MGRAVSHDVLPAVRGLGGCQLVSLAPLTRGVHEVLRGCRLQRLMRSGGTWAFFVRAVFMERPLPSVAGSKPRTL